MAPYYYQFDAIFWMGIVGSLVAVCGISIKYCYKCKIEDVTLCCNLIHIKRDVAIESNLEANNENTSDDIPSPRLSRSDLIKK